MGLAAYIIGGAMQGLGQGMALKQQSEDLDRRAELAERRAIAMENLKAQNQRVTQKEGNEQLGQREADRDARDLSSKRILAADSASYESAMASSKAAASAAENEREFQRKLKLLDAETNAKIREFNATYRDEIGDIVKDEVTGEATGVTKSGKKIPLGKIAQQQPRASASSSWLDDMPSGQGPLKPGAVPALPPGFILEK